MLHPLIQMPQAASGSGSGPASSSDITDLDIITESGTSRNVSDSDSGYLIRCTNASPVTVTFPDTVTAGSWGYIERAAGAGVVSWAASGSMVVTPSSESVGHTGTGDAPSIIYWFCDASNSVIVGGDTGPTDGPVDLIKLDDLAAPDDNTDLNATTSAHGLLPKLGGGSTNFLRADGTWAAPAGGSPGGSTNELQRNDGGSFGGATGVTWASNQLLIAAQDAATVPLAVKAAASHTANIQEWQNSAGTAQAFISASNRIHAAGGFSAGISGGAVAASITYQAGQGFVVERFGSGGMIATEGTNRGSFFCARNSGGFGWQSGTGVTGIPDTRLIRVDVAQVGFRGNSPTVGASINLLELSADPSDPDEGQCVIWQSDGTGSGDDGDVMAKITAGGVTKTATLIDFSAV